MIDYPGTAWRQNPCLLAWFALVRLFHSHSSLLSFQGTEGSSFLTVKSFLESDYFTADEIAASSVHQSHSWISSGALGKKLLYLLPQV